MAVYLIATLDTKGTEASYLRDLLSGYGVETILLDAGSGEAVGATAEITNEKVFLAAGTTLEDIRGRGDRGHAVAQAALGTAKIVEQDYATGRVSGVLGIGGSAGTTIATQAMRELPIGVPKLMVSTLASGNVRGWVGDKDILMLNAVVDIAGINRISRAVFGQAARAMAGMVALPDASTGQKEKPIIAATMFGVTTPCVQTARRRLEAAGYEVLIFHATGNGGQAMESLIREGLIAGVLDITTTELADEIVGGVLSAGPDRLTAAGEIGLPQVISVGATDMVNFGAKDTVPDQFHDRQFYQHNPTVTLMRTNVEENRRIGRDIGCKAAQAIGPTVILLPRQGVSAIDVAGGPFENPSAREALFDAVRSSCRKVPVIERNEHINDESFALFAAEKLHELIQQSSQLKRPSVS